MTATEEAALTVDSEQEDDGEEAVAPAQAPVPAAATQDALPLYKRNLVAALLSVEADLSRSKLGDNYGYHRTEAIARRILLDPVYGRMLSEDQIRDLAEALFELPKQGLPGLLDRSERQLNLPTQGPAPSQGSLRLFELRAVKVHSGSVKKAILSFLQDPALNAQDLVQVLIVAKLQELPFFDLKEILFTILRTKSDLLDSDVMYWMIETVEHVDASEELKMDLLRRFFPERGMNAVLKYKAVSICRAWLYTKNGISSTLLQKTLIFLKFAIENGVSKAALRNWRPTQGLPTTHMDAIFEKLTR